MRNFGDNARLNLPDPGPGNSNATRRSPTWEGYTLGCENLLVLSWKQNDRQFFGGEEGGRSNCSPTV